MSAALVSPVAALALLLVVAGAAKLVVPADTARALRAAGWPAGPAAIRTGAGAEAAIGVAVLAGAGPVATVLMALSYAGFAAFLAWALTSGASLSSCGCFGEPDTPPTLAHLVVCVAGAGASAAAAWLATPGLASAAADHPGRAIPLVVLTAGAAWAALLMMSAGPRLTAARRQLR